MTPFNILTPRAYQWWVNNDLERLLTAEDWRSIDQFLDALLEENEIGLIKDYLSDKVDDYIAEAMQKMHERHPELLNI